MYVLDFRCRFYLWSFQLKRQSPENVVKDRNEIAGLLLALLRLPAVPVDACGELLLSLQPDSSPCSFCSKSPQMCNED